MAWARAMTRSGRKGAEAIGYSNQLTVNSNQQLAAWRSLASHPGVCPLKPPSTVFGTFKFNYKVCLEGENPTQRTEFATQRRTRPRNNLNLKQRENPS